MSPCKHIEGAPNSVLYILEGFLEGVMSKSDLMHKQELAWQGAADMKVHEGATIARMRNGGCWSRVRKRSGKR